MGYREELKWYWPYHRIKLNCIFESSPNVEFLIGVNNMALEGMHMWAASDRESDELGELSWR